MGHEDEAAERERGEDWGREREAAYTEAGVVEKHVRYGKEERVRSKDEGAKGGGEEVGKISVERVV